MVCIIESIIFLRTLWNAETAREWMKQHWLVPIGIEITSSDTIRFPLHPGYYRRIHSRDLGGGVEIRMGFK